VRPTAPLRVAHWPSGQRDPAPGLKVKLCLDINWPSHEGLVLPIAAKTLGIVTLLGNGGFLTLTDLLRQEDRLFFCHFSVFVMTALDAPRA
jgi:hypothetical protein